MVDANVFKNSLTAAGYVTPEEWSNRIEQVARENSIMRQLTDSVVVMDRVGVPGNTHYIQKNAALAAADLTDGTATSISTISFSQISVSAAEIGVAVEITMKQLRDELQSVRGDILDNLAVALAEKEESKIFTELYTTAQADIYANGVTSGTIASSDTMNVALIIDGKTSMRVAKKQGRNLIVHPEQYGDLAKLQQFTDASYLGDDRVARNGFIGTFYGLNVYESTNVATATENSVTVYQSLLLGDRALVILDKSRPSVEMQRNVLQDRTWVMQAVMDAGYEILNDESIRVLKSA